jgi:hypothetical protein
MKAVLFIAVVAATVSFSAPLCFPTEPGDEKNPSFWMEKKLEYSQKVLVGLAKKDFEEIGKRARSLAALNQMERWVRSGVPEYRAQLQIFQNANQQLIRAADHENLDGAAMAYVQLTLSCVNCHKVMRDTRPTTSSEPK